MSSGYCMKCKKRQVIKDEKNISTKNNRTAITGFCNKCNTKIFTLQSSSKKQSKKQSKMQSKKQSKKLKNQSKKKN